MTDITQYTDVDLWAEINRRNYLRDTEATQNREERAKFLLANIDAILVLVTEHERTSCSDDNTCNSGVSWCRCKRCFILEARKMGYWDPDFDIEITLSRIS